MKNKMITLFLLLSLVLTACGTSTAIKELEDNDTNKAQAKIEEPSKDSVEVSESDAAEEEKEVNE